MLLLITANNIVLPLSKCYRPCYAKLFIAGNYTSVRMLCVFCRQNTTENPRRFQHFFIYCLHDGSRLDSVAASEKYCKEHGEQKSHVAMFCGECGGIFQSMKALSRHVWRKGFHMRRSRIVGYDKRYFNPCTDIPLPPEVQSVTTLSDVVTTSLNSVQDVSVPPVAVTALARSNIR